MGCQPRSVSVYPGATHYELGGAFRRIQVAEHNSRNPILYVILVLLIANLVLTASLFVSGSDRGAEPKETAANLPPYASDAELSRLAEHLQFLFNARDFAALYAEFDDLAKVQFTQQDLESQLSQFSSLHSAPSEAVFSEFLIPESPAITTS